METSKNCISFLLESEEKARLIEGCGYLLNFRTYSFDWILNGLFTVMSSNIHWIKHKCQWGGLDGCMDRNPVDEREWKEIFDERTTGVRRMLMEDLSCRTPEFFDEYALHEDIPSGDFRRIYKLFEFRRRFNTQIVLTSPVPESMIEKKFKRVMFGNGNSWIDFLDGRCPFDANMKGAFDLSDGVTVFDGSLDSRYYYTPSQRYYNTTMPF